MFFSIMKIRIEKERWIIMSDGTVLIVDDEPAIRKLLTRVAASCGYESLPLPTDMRQSS